MNKRNNLVNKSRSLLVEVRVVGDKMGGKDPMLLVFFLLIIFSKTTTATEDACMVRACAKITHTLPTTFIFFFLLQKESPKKKKKIQTSKFKPCFQT